MQGRQRRSVTEDYKRQAVELAVSSGRSIGAVAKELGLRDSVLRRWVDKVRQEPASAAWRPTERLMRRHGIRAIMAPPRRVRTTDSRHNLPIAPNLIARDFTAAAPNRVWLADITYIPTAEGWLYLAAVMDLFSRKIVGWAMRHHMQVELVSSALSMAIRQQQPGAGLIHHSDRGVQGGFTRISRGPCRHRHHRINEPQGRLLRQCPDGELLPHPQDRAHPSSPVSDPHRGPA
ncbi:transposase InsO family protein [Bradyrhizobium niftali]